MKRCLLLPLLNHLHEAILLESIREAPTTWCHMHFLKPGGAINRVQPGTNAFGCGSWTFAAVITARWPGGNKELERDAADWLDRTVSKVHPHAEGIYGSDLGPSDNRLARLSFGPNSWRLAAMKRKLDPLNLFRHGCPLTGTVDDDGDPRVTSEGVVVIFCRRRFAGKNWLAQITKRNILALTKNHERTIVSYQRSHQAGIFERESFHNADRFVFDR